MRSDWKKKDLELKPGHGWKAKPGYNICAINRGAIRFEYPQGWNVNADEDSLKIRDCPEPDDNCVLAVSQMHLPTEIADQVPLRELVRVSMDHDDRDIRERKEIVEVGRTDGVELAYVEVRYFDPKQKREAFSRLCVARGSGVYGLITFDFWVDDAAKFEPAWEQALRSLILGVYIKDPAVGPVIQ
ncbi:MAG: hypothetical protein ACR2NN_19860 [Bryobacteraceae bacterium]